VAVALRFGVAPDALLGHGGEAWVYALDDDRVLRILRDGGRKADLLRRMALVEELALAQPVYRLPEVLDVGEIEGRTYAMERRLPGRSMLEELGRIEGAARERLIEAYLDTSASLGDLHLPAHIFLLTQDLASSSPTTRSPLRHGGRTWRSVRPGICRGRRPNSGKSTLPPLPAAFLTQPPSFVHLDAFAGNFLTDGVRITAVIDFGVSSLAGDRRLDPIASAVYLSDPNLTPTVTARDVDIALAWLRAKGLAEWLEPGRRWLAAYWSFEADDPKAIAWCSDVLLRSQPII
jgi:hypothetical protein